LLKYGEIVDLSCKETDLKLFIPHVVLDALDETASEVWRFSDGRLMSVRKYKFVAPALVGGEIFRIPNLTVSPLFFSEGAVEKFRGSGLRMGIKFREVWKNAD